MAGPPCRRGCLLHGPSSRNRGFRRNRRRLRRYTQALTLPPALAALQGVHVRLVYHITVLVDWWAYLGCDLYPVCEQRGISRAFGPQPIMSFTPNGRSTRKCIWWCCLVEKRGGLLKDSKPRPMTQARQQHEAALATEPGMCSAPTARSTGGAIPLSNGSRRYLVLVQRQGRRTDGRRRDSGRDRVVVSFRMPRTPLEARGAASRTREGSDAAGVVEHVPCSEG